MSQYRKHKFKGAGIPLSRSTLFKCLVPECDTAHRADNLKRHYGQYVNEEALLTGHIDDLDSNQIKHTQYFINQGIKTLKCIPDKTHHTKVLGKCDENPISNFFSTNTTKKCQKRLIEDSEDENNEYNLQKVIRAENKSKEHLDSELGTTSKSKQDNIEIINVSNVCEETLEYSEDQHFSEANFSEESNSNIPLLSDSDSCQQKLITEEEPSTSKSNTKYTISDVDDNTNNTSQLYEIKTMMQEELKRVIRDEFDTDSNKNTGESFKDKLCKAVMEKMNESDSSLSSEAKQPTLIECFENNIENGILIEDYNNFHCKSCFKYKDSIDLPDNLKKYIKGNVGVFSKSQAKWNIKKSIKVHMLTSIHYWCQDKFENDLLQQKKQERINLEAGIKIHNNALYCLKKGFSSMDFIDLNSKDASSTKATKNDSKNEFFILRNIYHKILCEKVHQLFENVEEFSCTLDKVTVDRQSFTVLLCFFFSDGEIKCFLNKVVKMESNMYDSKGTACMVVNNLQKSLGLTIDQLRSKLMHFVYDGVYADSAERVYGGGSLSLTRSVETHLGQQNGFITGQWDIAHLLQLLFADVMKKNKILKNISKEIFDTMKDFRIGKASLKFHELAQELNNLILECQKDQQTRFISAWLKAIKAYMRNIPTIYSLMTSETESDNTWFRDTRSTHYEAPVTRVNNGELICLIIGLCQIFEIYTMCSINSQSSHSFPSTIKQEIMEAKDKISELSHKWVWFEDHMSLSGIGSPRKHIREMLENEKYTPHVPVGSISKNKSIIVEFYGQEEFERLVSEDNENLNDMPNLAGCVSIVNFDIDILYKCEQTMQNICSDIIKEWNIRFVTNPFMDAVHAGFGIVKEHSEEDLKNILSLVIMNHPQKETYNIETILPEYKFYNDFALNCKARNTNMSIEKNYSNFLKENEGNPNVKQFKVLHF